MRRRLVIGTVLVIVAVLAALVPPVVVLLRRAAERELEVRLSSQASAISTEIADELLSTGQLPPVEDISRFVPAGDVLVITDSDDAQILRFPTKVTTEATPGHRSAGPPAVHWAHHHGVHGRQSANRRVRTPLMLLAGFAAAAIALELRWRQRWAPG